MPNLKYNRAAAMERRVKKEWEAKGYIAARSAGSHSPFMYTLSNQQGTKPSTSLKYVGWSTSRL